MIDLINGATLSNLNPKLQGRFEQTSAEVHERREREREREREKGRSKEGWLLEVLHPLLFLLPLFYRGSNGASYQHIEKCSWDRKGDG